MKSKLFRLILAALFAAMVCVATFIIQIPIAVTGGYINMGDCFVLLCGMVFGSWGFFSAGLGSALADVFFGYFLYAPATFLIKGIMALFMGIIFCRLKKKATVINLSFFGILAETFMVFGYFLYECFVLCYGIGAAAAIPGNIIQGIFGAAVNTVLVLIIQKNSKLKSLLAG